MKVCKYLAAALLLFSISSCKKSFLDVSITQKVIAEEYVTSLSRAEEFLNGIYFIVARDVYSDPNAQYADIIADNLKEIATTQFSTFYNWDQVASEYPQNENMNSMWLEAYNVIRSCNFIIGRVDLFRNENPSRADWIKGQAYALRALLHTNILNVFAQPYKFTNDASHLGIPYDTIYSQSQLITRQSVGDVYKNIINDFNRAILLIPQSSTNQGTITQNAVKALLARIHLFKGDFISAKKFALEVAAAVPIMSSGDYPQKLFTNNDKESIFWLPPAATSTTGSTLFQGYYFAQTDYFGATSDLVNIIKENPNDRRNNWFKNTTGNWQILKFPQGAVSGILYPGMAYYNTIIRSSEMCLTVAESYANLGNDDSARYYLDVIRKRADNTATTSIATGIDLLDSIYRERRKELCFENLRMFDLLRLKKGVNRVDIVSNAPKTLPYPSDKAIAPIPQIDVKVYGLTQNPGY